MTPGERNLVLLVLMVVLWRTHAKTCAEFEFPTATGDTVTAREGSNITLPFRIKPWANCSKDYFSELRVHGSYSDYDDEYDYYFMRSSYCSFAINGGNCAGEEYGSPSCDCERMEDKYQVKLPADRRMNGTWEWWGENYWPYAVIQTKILYFDVHYDARIVSLTTVSTNSPSTNLLEKDTAVDLVCIWETGNPPVSVARLSDREGKELPARNSSFTEIFPTLKRLYQPQELRYTFSSVRCEDMGMYSCDTTATSYHSRAKLTLLVRCPPIVTLPVDKITTVSGEGIELTVHIRSHTANITSCFLKETLHFRRIHRCNTENATGRPPDMKLVVRLDDVTEADEGGWKLEMTNDVGAGEAYFDLRVTKEDHMAPKVTVHENELVVVFGGDTELRVHVRSHTRKFTGCRLEKMFSLQTPQQCDVTNLTGIPPDLWLTVFLEKVNKSDDGFWKLELTNEAGSGQAEFRLKVHKSKVRTDEGPGCVPTLSGPVKVAVVITVGGVVVVVLVAVALLVLCRRCCRGRRRL